MVDWRILEAKVDKTIGAAFGEGVRHQPIKNGQVDDTRPVSNFRAVLHTPTPEGTIQIAGDIVSSANAAEAALVIQRADVPGVVFRKLDKIRGSDLPGQPWWEIKAVNDRYTSIIILALNQA